VHQAGKEERIKVLGLSWTRDDASREDIPNLVALVRRKIQDYPDIDPAVRLFVAIELCAVDREHYYCVVVTNETIFHGVEIIRAAKNIIKNIFRCIAIARQFVPSLVPSVEHFLGHLRALPTRLQLWTEGKCSEDLSRILLLPTRLLEYALIVSRLATVGAR